MWSWSRNAVDVSDDNRVTTVLRLERRGVCTRGQVARLWSSHRFPSDMVKVSFYGAAFSSVVNRQYTDQNLKP